MNVKKYVVATVTGIVLMMGTGYTGYKIGFNNGETNEAANSKKMKKELTALKTDLKLSNQIANKNLEELMGYIDHPEKYDEKNGISNATSLFYNMAKGSIGSWITTTAQNKEDLANYNKFIEQQKNTWKALEVKN
jgi:hypothetical protein